jgi:replicative DNA helicase Mcm
MAEQANRKKKQEEIITEAKGFFNSKEGKRQVGESIRGEEKRVVHLDFQLLSEFAPSIADSIIESPEEAIALVEIALGEISSISNPRIRFENLPKSIETPIRRIRAKHLDQMISIEGIVRNSSEVRPRVVNARFECPNCGAILSVLQIDEKFREPSRCTCGWKAQFKLISKEMVDVQRLVIEESPDTLEGGEQPKRISVWLKEDLVDPRMEERTTPGSRIKTYGVLKEVPIPLRTGSISTRYDLTIEAHNIIPMEESLEELNISEEEVKQILELSADPHLYKRLSQSIAPSIYGFERIKEAVLLQIFGGIKKTKSDSGKTRGDIHILLVGDPGVAKSVLLKFMSSVAPKGRYVSGKAATAAGLTAAVVKDEFLRGWSLEAGAMILANKGTLCLDEIEKMSEQDRSAMHEAMEQQCYHKDFKLLFADGSRKKISDFVDEIMEKNKKNVQQGINCEILDLNENKNVLTTDFESIYPIRIKNVSRHIAPENFIKISLSNGRKIIVTPEHPCWVVRDGSIATISAKEIKESEFFPIPAEMPIDGEEQHFEFKPYKNGKALCKLLGYHISDGCDELNRGRKNGIQFWNNDIGLINDYKQAISDYFGLSPGITQRNNQFAVRAVSNKIVEFMNCLDKNLLEKGIYKKIPEQIMKSKKEDLAYLLRALFDGDGTIVNAKRNGCRIGLISKNQELAEQVQEILSRFGIISSIYQDKQLFRIDICGNENLLRYYQNVGFLSEKKQMRLKEYLAKQKTYRSITDIIPNSSKAINRIYKTLKIKASIALGNQIYTNCNKHRLSLKKMVEIAENRLGLLLMLKEEVSKTNSAKELGEIRKKAGLSCLCISGKLSLSNYLLSQHEKKDIFIEGYQELIAKEIDCMIKIAPKLRELKKLAFGKIRWSKVKSVEFVKNTDSKWVYDIAIEPTHSFISNNMILHNSISISKANIHATLRAETTVLAAGNPKLGRFDPYTPITQQIDISPALLSRFDVIFVIRDLPNKTQDEAIAMHVLEEHKQGVIRDVIEQKLLRKYIAYAKQKIKPKLTDSAIEEIKNFYVKLRNQSVSTDAAIKPIPITARQLEGIVRLAEASAKMRLSDKVTTEDAKKAIELLKMSLTQVGYDEETKSFDIDKMTTGITSSKRNKILLVRDIITLLESRVGKLVPLEDIEKETAEKLAPNELSDILDQLKKSGEIFMPNSKHIQRTTNR